MITRTLQSQAHPNIVAATFTKLSTLRQSLFTRSQKLLAPIAKRVRGGEQKDLCSRLAMGPVLSLQPQRDYASNSVLRAQDRRQSLDTTDSDNSIWIVVGLGNPGREYEGNRHNVGFMTLDALVRREGVRLNKVQLKSTVARCSIAGQRVLLVKPLTYMNLCGESVIKLAKFYKVPTERILVIYDDLDTPVAKVRLRAKGGHGGHNGIRSLSQHLQGDFPRIKIGVGRPPGNRTVIDHVLQDFSRKEREEIDVAIQESLALVDAIFKHGLVRAVSGMR